MPDENPIVEEPSTEAPAAVGQPRMPWAWVFLALVFGTLIASAVSGGRSLPPSTTVDEAGLVVRLKSAVFSRTTLLGQPQSAARDKAVAQAEGDLRGILTEVKASKDKDPVAARFALVVGSELGSPPDAAALGYLEKSEKPDDQAFARLYSTTAPTPADVAKAALPKNFMGRLAKAQALHRTGAQGAAATALTPIDTFQFMVLGAGALVLVAGGLGALLFGVLSLLLVRIKPVGYPVGPLTPADADRLAFRMAVFLGLLALLPALVAALFGGRLVTGAASLIGEVVTFALFLAFLKTPLAGGADPWPKLVGRVQNWPKLAAIGVWGFLANVPLVVVFALLFQFFAKDGPRPTHPLTEQLGAGASPLTAFFFFMVAAVMAPLLEETSFRGLLFPALGRFMPPVVAMLLSGLLFAAMHPQGPMLWAALGSVGAVSACLAYYTGSLVPSLVMHAVHNGAILALSFAVLS